jgi:hypothetical protein
MLSIDIIVDGISEWKVASNVCGSRGRCFVDYDAMTVRNLSETQYD